MLDINLGYPTPLHNICIRHQASTLITLHASYLAMRNTALSVCLISCISLMIKAHAPRSPTHIMLLQCGNIHGFEIRVNRGFWVGFGVLGRVGGVGGVEGLVEGVVGFLFAPEAVVDY